ncbi:MAG: GNAT family N-acetyltransferase [Spirochaetes bacterium]|nr:GNAT family N-acetyltransferase [Spirochaetota bacterium]
MQRDIPFRAVLESYRARASGIEIPLSFYAVAHTMPVGMVSLKRDDLWERRDLNPWLASLYVLPEFRNRGIAGLLMDAVVDRAAVLGLERIYLFLGQSEKASLQAYYSSRGWAFFDRAADNDGADTEIYSYTINRR